ncbi:hypothetical protein CHCC14814_2954 [Bacillus paralicheniformis]|nr:hypothetical protein CHCC14814_2954 [Bacillus paralicheniformis]
MLGLPRLQGLRVTLKKRNDKIPKQNSFWDFVINLKPPMPGGFY